MSQSPSKPGITPFRIIAPVAVLLLCGAAFLPAFRGDDSTAAGPAAANRGDADSGVVPGHEEIARQASRLPARPGSLATFDGAIADPMAGLAQLHRKMGTQPSQRAEGEKLLVQMEQTHQSEPVDATWSAKSEQSVLAAAETPVVTRAGLKPANLATDCRSQTCRISASFPTSGDAHDWADRFTTQMGGTMSRIKVAVVPQDDGTFEVRMYGTRA